jgi:hydrogenase maturation factor HypE
MMNPKESGAQTEVGSHNTIGVAMEDLPEVERRALEKELEEEMAEVRRRKLMCFKKTRTGVIKKAIPAITTTVTTTSMVTPNLTPEELVKFMDVAVASKYGNDLTNFIHTITEEVRNTSDKFKTDLQNMLPWQITSVVQ